MFNIKYVKLNYRPIIFSAIFAVLFSITTFLGIALDNLGTIWVKYNRLSIFIIFIISYTIFRLFLKFLPKIETFLASIKPLPTIDNLFFQNNYKSFLNVFLFIVITHFPVFLAYFPGIFTYDVLFQANFFFHHDFIEIHPILHNLMVYWTLLFNDKFHTAWGGVFVYTLIQTTIMFLIFSYCIKFLSKYNFAFIYKFFALLYFAFYPTNQVFPLITTKDVLFSGFVLLFVLLLSECILDKDKFVNSKVKYTSFIITIILMFLFRHNGFPAYILISPIIFIYLAKSIKNHAKKILIMLLLPIFIFCGFTIFKQYIGIKSSPKASTLGIPIQQIGRVMYLHHYELSQQDKDFYLSIIHPYNAYNYHPLCVDDLKIDSVMFHSDYIEQALNNYPDKFIYLYTKWGKRYPKEYTDAFLANNYTLWFFFKYYQRIGLHYYLYTHNRWNNIFGIKVCQKTLNMPIMNLYDKIFIEADFSNPIIFLCFSIGVNTWLVIIGFIILLYKRRYENIMSVLIIAALFLSVMFGPIVLLRYVYQNFLILPLLFAFCFSNIEQRKLFIYT